MENKKPVREIPIQNFSVSGKFPSIKNKRTVYYESQLELDFIYYLEFAQEVENYLEQPCKIKSPSGKFYVPDFLVNFKYTYTSKPLLIEIKYTEDIKKNSEKLAIKFKTLTEYALNTGYNFKVLTENELQTTRKENYKFLYGYINSVKSDEQNDLITKIIKTVEKYQPIKVGKIIELLSNGDLHKKGIYLSYIWHLIAISTLWVNLDKDLTERSEVYLNKNKQGEICHLWR